MKICSVCGLEKPLSDFNKEKRAKDGHRYSCRECDKERMKKYLKRIGSHGRLERIKKQRQRRRENPLLDRMYQKKYREKNRAKDLIRHAKMRAMRKHIQFDLGDHVQAIQKKIDAGHCEMTGMKFDMKNGRTYNSPSIDRINPKMGYTIENIRIVCHLMNCAMGDWGENVLKNVMIKWLEK